MYCLKWAPLLLFTCSVMSDSLRTRALHHPKLACSSLSPGVCSNSCSLSRWCYLTIWSSSSPFSLCLQSLPTSGSFPMSQLFTSGGQIIAATASASVLPKSIQGWFPLGLTDLVFLQSKGPSRVFSSTTIQKHEFLSAQPSLCFMVQLSHPYMTIGKSIALTTWTFVSKVLALLLNCCLGLY